MTLPPQNATKAWQATGAFPNLRTVRGRLVALVMLMLLPTTAIALVAAMAVYYNERGAVTATALETAKALSLVADREMAVRAAVLRTLAGSPQLKPDDLLPFYLEARAAAPSAENAIALYDPDGRQLMNTRVQFGQQPPPPQHWTPLATAAPAQDLVPPMLVTDLYVSPLLGTASVSVRVPVQRDGKLIGYLGMASVARQLQRLFDQQPLPPGWVAGLYDRQGVLIARNVDAERFVGHKAPPELLNLIVKAPEGMVQTRTFLGAPVQAVFHRAPASGWIIAIGVPHQALRQPAWQAFGAMMLITLLFTGIVLFAALRIGRGISEPVLQLRSDAERLGRGEALEPGSTGLDETDAVQRRLAEASRERAEADLRLRDTVAQAVAETERAQRTVLSVQKLEALGRLTGGIAHDFNNLLQTMTTGLKLASRLASDERARIALTACEQAVSKAVKLTRQLMTFGRTQPGVLEVVDLQRHLGGLRELLQGAVSDAVAVSLEVADGVWPVQVDPVQLELAVLNLALNARDAMPDGGRIVIRVRNHLLAEGEVAGLPAGEHVEVTVADDGEGMPPEVMQHVFEPFYTTKPLGKGTGLGLAQVYSFATYSRGAATVNSQPGIGTEVTIWLPRSTAAAAHEAEAPVAQPGRRYQGTVLLVEDDGLVRNLTAQALQGMGFAVEVAASAEEAIALARAKPEIDVVLSDIVMPGGQSGVDLARTLRVLRPALAVVLASGYAQALETDVPVIAKPYNVDQVAEVLARHVSARHGQAATS